MNLFQRCNSESTSFLNVVFIICIIKLNLSLTLIIITICFVVIRSNSSGNINQLLLIMKSNSIKQHVHVQQLKNAIENYKITRGEPCQVTERWEYKFAIFKSVLLLVLHKNTICTISYAWVMQEIIAPQWRNPFGQCQVYVYVYTYLYYTCYTNV